MKEKVKVKEERTKEKVKVKEERTKEKVKVKGAKLIFRQLKDN